MIRETNSIIQMGIAEKIFIAGMEEENCPDIEDIDANIRLFRIKSIQTGRGNILKYLLRFTIYNINVLRIFSKKELRPEVVNCHSLSVLPIGVLFKWFYRCHLIYDTHELETERAEMSKPLQKIAQFAEKMLISQCDKVITVCQPIAEWYINTYHLKQSQVLEIKNTPIVNGKIKEQKSSIFRKKFNIPDEAIIFIYQGVLAEVRGVFILIDAFIEANSNRHLILMGYGDIIEQVISYTEKYSNIHYQEAVAVEDIIEYSSGADIGVFFIPPNSSLSYRYSLPNKFFEYLTAGIPVLVNADLEYLTKLIDANNYGWSLDTINAPTVLSQFVQSITKETIKQKEKNVRIAQTTIGWELEEKKLLAAFSFKKHNA